MSKYLAGATVPGVTRYYGMGAEAPPPAPGMPAGALPLDVRAALGEGVVRMAKLADATQTRIKGNAFKDSIILATVALPVGLFKAGQSVTPSEVTEGMDNALQLNKSIAAVVLEISQKGTITNPDTGKPRTATREDAARLFGVLARQAECFALLAQVSDMLSINGGVAEVFKRTVRDFAQMAADFYQAGRKVVAGANRTIAMLGTYFPIVALGAGGFALFMYTRGGKR